MSLIENSRRTRWRQMSIALVAGAILFYGCGGGNGSVPQKAEVVPGLRLQKVELQKIEDELEAPGNVIAVVTAQMAARTMGTVIKVAVQEGDTVRRGQLLAQLDDRELTARRNAAQAASQGATSGVGQAAKALAAAQAQADVMQKTYDRYAYLNEQKSVSPQEFDEILAKHEASQANLEQAKAGLSRAEAGATQATAESQAAQDVASYARVVAPFDGRVVRRTVEAGSLVSPGTPLFVVEDTSRYQLEVTLPAGAQVVARKNSVARVQLDAFGEKSLAGKVSEVEAGADPASHTLKARIDLPKEMGLRSGLFGRAFFARGEKRALMVMSEALVTRGQLTGVYVVGNGNLAHWRVLTLGKPIGNQTEVLSGLSGGETVVLNPGGQELDGKKAGGAAGNGENRP